MKCRYCKRTLTKYNWYLGDKRIDYRRCKKCAKSMQKKRYRKKRKEILKKAEEYRKKRLDYSRNNILTFKGKKVKVRKRKYTGYCEMCNIRGRKLAYHHWDDSRLELGIWVCLRCHTFVELVDKGFHEKYLEFKKDLNKQYIEDIL